MLKCFVKKYCKNILHEALQIKYLKETMYKNKLEAFMSFQIPSSYYLWHFKNMSYILYGYRRHCN